MPATETTGMAAAAADLAARAAHLSDVAFTAACHDFIDVWKTLPDPLPDLRDACLRRLRDRAVREGRKINWLARQLKFTPKRFSTLTRRATTQGAAA